MSSKRDSRQEQIAEELYRQLKQDNAHTFPPSVEKAGNSGEAHKDVFPPSGEKASVGGEADSDAPPVSSKELDASEGDENDTSVFPPSGAKSGGSGE